MPKPDIITQAELRAAWNTWTNFGNTLLGIRRRIESGVPIEPGYIQANSAGASAPIEDEIDGILTEPNGFEMFGLAIGPNRGRALKRIHACGRAQVRIARLAQGECARSHVPTCVHG